MTLRSTRDEHHDSPASHVDISRASLTSSSEASNVSDIDDKVVDDSEGGIIHEKYIDDKVRLGHQDRDQDRLESEKDTPDQRDKRPQLDRVPTSSLAAPYTGPDLFYSPSRIGDGKSGLRSSRRPSAISSVTTLSRRIEDTGLEPVHMVSTDSQGITYPEGGLEAWLCVLGAFCGMMAALGIMNSIGTIEAYVSQHQLRDTSPSITAWIFGLYAFLAFFCGIQIGPLFDAKGPRALIAAGSVLNLLSLFLLGLCTQYWHFMLVFGFIGGLGTSLILTPSVAAVGHFFLRRRGLATGIAATGGSMGGVVFPLVLQALFPRLGWAGSTRVIGYINIGLLTVANCCVRSRLPPTPATRAAILPDFRIFRDPIFALTTLGVFFVEWALFLPLTYLTSYAVAKGVDSTFAYQLIAIFNAGSCFGRWVPGLLADTIGRFNTMLITVVLCMVSTLALWLPSNYLSSSSSSSLPPALLPLVILYALIFGFASGSGISLTPVCVSQLCKLQNYGRYYATCYTLVSFACLTGIPIAGALLQACGGGFVGLIIFTGVSYAASIITFGVARGMGGGWTLRSKF